MGFYMMPASFLWNLIIILRQPVKEKMSDVVLLYIASQAVVICLIIIIL